VATPTPPFNGGTFTFLAQSVTPRRLLAVETIISRAGMRRSLQELSVQCARRASKVHPDHSGEERALFFFPPLHAFSRGTANRPAPPHARGTAPAPPPNATGSA
jgi:hypothetical protein